MKTSLFDLLKSNYVFSNLDRYAFSIIEDYLFFRSLDTQDFLFHEGQHGDFIAFVVAGNLEILKQDDTGNNIHIANKKVGDSVGDMSLLDDLSRSASARASEKTGLIILPRPDFERILREQPQIGILMLKGLMAMLSLNLRQTSTELSKAKSEIKSQSSSSPS